MRKVKLGWYVWMLRSERKVQTQDPGSKSEPGAPSALLWFVNVRMLSVFAVHCLGYVPPHFSLSGTMPPQKLRAHQRLSFCALFKLSRKVSDLPDPI